MFKLVVVESWVSEWGLPAISTLCFMFVLGYWTLRALHTHRNKLDEMAAKPLDDGEMKNLSDN
ncbi:hypothetical protein [Sulfuriroseicoccus oceanibius]|uniref:Uncharacterized protein n=1 Tax=Sulfuriroseicoccus oceanibius TaxID=2707525 RepID=A0A6B3L643_9BACT|nr:hypothetical protein [Sulfuriroseicoccus oceanibius]QQL46080.1 hypothetical protein G3M56_005730 [Sulfuriroseicoccus oceanibius]